MSFVFEEIDFQQTPLGAISLRRRSEPRLNNQVLFEVKLNEEFLMSSLFTEAEIQLSKLGLAALEGNDWDVVVGGLGLGYTAVAALEFSQLKTLQVVDVMEPVISWHQKELVPLGAALNKDERCTLVHADFFDVATNAKLDFNGQDIDPVTGGKKVHAILLDIDHSPSYWLNPGNCIFYTEQGLKDMSQKLHSGGIFALWSDEPPAQDFMDLLNTIFESCESHVVTFPNPYTHGESTNTVYVARNA
jgi:spermidine synthase